MGNVALYTHLGFSRLLNASGFNAQKEADFIKHLRTESRESRERARERERAGERKDGWEIERVGGLDPR